MILTNAIKISYAYPTAATSAVGFSSLKQSHGASAPKSLGAFFSPKGFLFGGMQWEAFGLAGLRVSRSANPLYAVAIIFSRIGCRLVSNHHTDNLIMNVFTVRSSATLLELAEQAAIRAAQVQALAETIANLSDAPENFQDRRQFVRISNLMWLLEDLLPQHTEVCAKVQQLVQRGVKHG